MLGFITYLESITDQLYSALSLPLSQTAKGLADGVSRQQTTLQILRRVVTGRLSVFRLSGWTEQYECQSAAPVQPGSSAYPDYSGMSGGDLKAKKNPAEAGFERRNRDGRYLPLTVSLRTVSIAPGLGMRVMKLAAPIIFRSGKWTAMRKRMCMATTLLPSTITS